MIDSLGAAMMLDHMFLDPSGPYAVDGFALSLHLDVAAIASSELVGVNYARVLISAGSAAWAVGTRAAINRIPITFPVAGADGWRAIRSTGLWSVNHNRMVWPLPIDGGAMSVAEDDQLVIPPGGLVYRLG